MSADEQASPSKRRLSRTGRVVVAIIVLVVVVYGIVVALYATSGRVAAIDGAKPTPPKDGVLVVLTPQSINATGERVVMDVGIQPSDRFDSGGGVTLSEAINVIVAPASGDQVVQFKKGTVPSSATVNIVTPGSVENWPFDSYRAKQLVVVAYTTKNGEEEPIRTNVQLDGYVPGWNVDAVAKPSSLIVSDTDGKWEYLRVADLKAWRAGSTIAFGIVLLALMVVMPSLVLFVAISAYRGLRKVEASFMSWMGAMLFATIPLRTFLPGSPPIGSWIDFLVVLWVIVGLIGGLVIYVSAWWRWGARGEAAKVEPPTIANDSPKTSDV